MDFHAVCCTLLLLTTSSVCFGQELILPDILRTAVGESIVISPLRIPNPPYHSIRWRVNTTTILVGPLNGIVIRPPYTDRASLDPSTLALELLNLFENDTGEYSLTVDTDTEAVTGQTSLHVLVPVSNVNIVPTQTELVEFNSTVSLVCSASGSSLSFIWLNGSSEVTADERIHLTDNNSTLSITSVNRGDTGPYRCEASNMLGNKTSPQLNLIIYYGPENVAIAADPAGPIYSSGSNLKLTCSAESSPAAEFQWAVNGTHLGETGPELKLNNIQISQSGNYTCIAHNKQSLRYSISEPISVTVLVPVSEVSIKTKVKEVELNSTVSFVCSASGSSLSFIWLNNSFEVTAGERVQLTDNNRNMTITGVIQGDKGPYECEASNSISKKKSLPVILTININGNVEGDGGSLSAGVIAGIVIGVLLGVVAIAGLIFYIVKDKKQLGITSSGNKKNGASPNGQHELHYADIHHNQKQPGISSMSPDPKTSQSNKNATVDPASVIYSDLRNV